jgi:hypothetical protein
MPTMSWNRVEGFEGNEARLGARNSSETQPVLSVLTEKDYQYSDYYRPKSVSLQFRFATGRLLTRCVAVQARG